MRRISRFHVLILALLLLLRLILLTTHAVSHSHAGVVRLFAYSLFVLLGLLPFGLHCVEPPVQTLAA